MTFHGQPRAFSLQHNHEFTAPLCSDDYRLPIDYQTALASEELEEIQALAKFSLPSFKLHDILLKR